MTVFTDDYLKMLKRSIYAAKQDKPGFRVGSLPESLEALVARLEAAEDCVEATRKWLVNLGPQEEIERTMIKWRKTADK